MKVLRLSCLSMISHHGVHERKQMRGYARLDLHINPFHLSPCSGPSASSHKPVGCVDLDFELPLLSSYLKFLIPNLGLTDITPTFSFWPSSDALFSLRIVLRRTVHLGIGANVVATTEYLGPRLDW